MTRDWDGEGRVRNAGGLPLPPDNKVKGKTMPIKKTVGYASSDGVVHATVEGAQKAELIKLFSPEGQGPSDSVWNAERLAEHALANVDKLVDVLTTGPKSRPKARKAVGTTAPKRAVAGKTASTEKTAAAAPAKADTD